ncbi:putative aldouronate transport system permease protein [Cohnella sp. OV330]|uniref:carbohydrate ABC transporter permease n=1 Tax=Cohnella sp. OV330 TaxID=1855288 RepID=UPI0008E5DD66|nr:carbohydrate ABC transporter permease [Cohnella sp. OV330]SFA74275.1 putative aldouronate transport system permease protein [Cohnella sp. OV330]
MTIKRSLSEHLFDAANVIIMLILVVLTLYPFYYVLMASVSDANLLVGHEGLLLWPKNLSMAAYDLVMKNPNILTGYRNTIAVVTLGTTLNIFMTSLGAYVLSRKGLYWMKPLSVMIVLTMFFSGGLIPTYLLVNNTLHLGDSLFALILPGLISTWNLIVMRTSFEALPEALMESARIDGAGEWRILFKVVMPLSLPVISVMILFYGVSHWNAWFSAVIYLRDRELFPLQVILREILIQNSTDSMMTGAGSGDRESIGESIKYATIIVATLPILVVYPFLQKYFVKGVMVGAVKE